MAGPDTTWNWISAPGRTLVISSSAGMLSPERPATIFRYTAPLASAGPCTSFTLRTSLRQAGRLVASRRYWYTAMASRSMRTSCSAIAMKKFLWLTSAAAIAASPKAAATRIRLATARHPDLAGTADVIEELLDDVHGCRTRSGRRPGWAGSPPICAKLSSAPRERRHCGCSSMVER
ncbi:hypothetical protein ARTHRO8AJ_50006 [Arthrobacter sp. 8AJ]|nr:hypothetical protein ARTHRO8AJ_50006 [Arthrobacter sp. 8AJ]